MAILAYIHIVSKQFSTVEAPISPSSLARFSEGISMSGASGWRSASVDDPSSDLPD